MDTTFGYFSHEKWGGGGGGGKERRELEKGELKKLNEVEVVRKRKEYWYKISDFDSHIHYLFLCMVCGFDMFMTEFSVSVSVFTPNWSWGWARG